MWEAADAGTGQQGQSCGGDRGRRRPSPALLFPVHHLPVALRAWQGRKQSHFTDGRTEAYGRRCLATGQRALQGLDWASGPLGVCTAQGPGLGALRPTSHLFPLQFLVLRLSQGQFLVRGGWGARAVGSTSAGIIQRPAPGPGWGRPAARTDPRLLPLQLQSLEQEKGRWRVEKAQLEQSVEENKERMEKLEGYWGEAQSLCQAVDEHLRETQAQYQALERKYSKAKRLIKDYQQKYATGALGGVGGGPWGGVPGPG